RFGDQSVSAKPAAYAEHNGGYFLELDKPFKDAKPLTFDGTKESPYFAISYGKTNAKWTTYIGGMKGGMYVSPNPAGAQRHVGSPGLAVITDKQGTPVALTANADLPI